MPFLRLGFAGALLCLSASAMLGLGFLAGCSGSESSGGEAGTGGGGGTQPPAAALDRSEVSYVDNLLAKVADGGWTLEEGLIASLEVIAGERDETSILRHAELHDAEGTGILTMASEYLEHGPDGDIRTEIASLLERIVHSSERLEEMAGMGSAKSSGLATKQGIQNCLDFFEGYQTPPGVGNCLQYQSTLLLDEQYPGDYRVFGPAPPWPSAGWTQHHFELALEALEEAVPIYKAMGKLPPVSIVLSATNNGSTSAAAASKYDPPCGVVVYKKMQAQTDGDFKQILAHELGHCFQQATFTEQNEVEYKFVMWREEGLANYLSNLVYPDNNREWGKPPARRSDLNLLAKWELASTVLERSYTNSIFFQYLGQRLGDDGVFALVRSLPSTYGTGTQEQAAALARYANMDRIYHDFAKALTDKEVIDTSGQPIPYALSEVNRPTAKLDSPVLIMEDFGAFNVSRYRLSIDDDKRAELSYSPKGKLREDSRPEGGGDWKAIPSELPGTECVQDLIVVVTTTAANTGYELATSAPEDSEAACGIVGTWTLDNDSLQFNEEFFKLEHVTGRVSVTFESNGIATVVYDDFETKFSKETQLYQEILELLVVRTEENTFTTNATGTTLYEVMGDEIYFGDLFESDYLVGVKKHHYVRRFEPQGIIGNNLERTFEEHPDGLYLFSAFVKFELEPGGAVMRFLGLNDQVDAVLHRTGPAP